MLIKALRAHEFGAGENRIVKLRVSPARIPASGLGFRGSGY